MGMVLILTCGYDICWKLFREPSNNLVTYFLKLINEHIENLNEEEKKIWLNMLVEINQITEIQGRSLGKKKLSSHGEFFKE